MPSRKEIEDSIKELQEKLKVLDDVKIKEYDGEEMVPQLKEPDFDIHDIIEAKKQSKVRAGLVKNNDSGGIDMSTGQKPFKVPTNMIHSFENLEFCECSCHGRGKIDCQECYDHPTHLEELRKQI